MQGRKFSEADLPGEPYLFEEPDAVPVEINFVPTEPVPSRGGMGMVIVVPAFAKSEHRYPPVVGRLVMGSKAA